MHASAVKVNGMPHNLPTFIDVQDAANRLQGVAHKTPVLQSRTLNAQMQAQVFIKCENFQRMGAFKFRGGYNALAKLDAAQQQAGVVAYSSGNHAQAVALSAGILGMPATIFMPHDAAPSKLAATQGYGAKVIGYDRYSEDASALAAKLAHEQGMTFIPPFDHIDVIIGQGTVGMEIFDQVEDVQTIIVSIGGGGLAAGVAVAAKLRAKARGKKVQVIGVQAENAASYVPSLRAGKPKQIDTKPTIADGIAVARPGAIPFELIKKHIDKVVTVSDSEIALAIVALAERAKMVVEPAGAASVAALLTGKVKPRGTTVAVLSGGNLDPLLMQKIIGHGLEAANRYTTITVMLPDRPGQLVKTSEAIARAHGNVVEVLHTRHGRGLGIGEVELQISVETSDREHVQRIMDELNSSGLKARIDHED